MSVSKPRKAYKNLLWKEKIYLWLLEFAILLQEKGKKTSNHTPLTSKSLSAERVVTALKLQKQLLEEDPFSKVRRTGRFPRDI